MLQNGALLPHFLHSLGRVSAGFVGGSLCGIGTGILMGGMTG